MPPANVEDFGELVRWNHGSGWIARRVGDDHARARSDGLFNRRGSQAEIVFGLRGHKHGLASRVLHDVRVAHPIGRGNDHLVARTHQRAGGVENRVLTAGGHDAFRRLKCRRRAQICRMPVANGLAQRRDSRRRGVLRAIFFERLDGRALDVFRRGKVGLAGAEVDHIHSLGLVLFRLLQHCHGGRDADAVYAIRQVKSFFLHDSCGRFHSCPFPIPPFKF